MNQSEILDKRIVTAKRCYEEKIQIVIDVLRMEQKRIGEGKLDKYYEVSNIGEVFCLLSASSELGALLALKDQIENQARD